jgi:hypothetical protein
MRVIVFAVAASLTVLNAIGLGRAYALSAPPALSAAVAENSLTRRVAYVCHRWWQWHGARWVRTCRRAGHEPQFATPWTRRGWYEPCW